MRLEEVKQVGMLHETSHRSQRTKEVLCGMVGWLRMLWKHRGLLIPAEITAGLVVDPSSLSDGATVAGSALLQRTPSECRALSILRLVPI